jgi:tRNA(Ile)-lysidine synthetase-like protein
MVKLGYNVTVAHFNHGWRVESEEEEEFVSKICKDNNLKFYVEKFTPKSKTEEEARNARWDFLKKVANLIGCNKIATGHNANDRIETAIINLTRGCGLQGLTSMSYKNDIIVRPVLDCSSDEIRKFCNDNNIEYRIDSSNFNTDYKRNLVRQQIAPLFTNVEPVVRSLNNCCSSNSFIQCEVDKYVEMWNQSTSNWFSGLIAFETSIECFNLIPKDLKHIVLSRVVSKVIGNGKDITSKMIKECIKAIGPDNCFHSKYFSMFCWNERLYITESLYKKDWKPTLLKKGVNIIDGSKVKVTVVEDIVVVPKNNVDSSNRKKVKNLMNKLKIPPFLRWRIPVFVLDSERVALIFPEF